MRPSSNPNPTRKKKEKKKEMYFQADGVAHVVESLPRKCEALSSILSNIIILVPFTSGDKFLNVSVKNSYVLM
jgi:hypothetical protein